jgi:hypothetical protein
MMVFLSMHHPDQSPFERVATGDITFELLMFAVGLVVTIWFVWTKILMPVGGWLLDKTYPLWERWTAGGRSQRAADREGDQ